MSDKDKTFETIDKTIAAVNSLATQVRVAEHDWHWRKLREYAAALFERGPFRKGDRVRIVVAPTIEGPNHGWWGARHFLVVGAVGTVGSVDFFGGKFVALVAFDDETWIDRGGAHHVPDRPSLYSLSESEIERIDTDGSVP